MTNSDLQAVRDALAALRAELSELDVLLWKWNSDNTGLGRVQKSLAARIVSRATYLKKVIVEHSYTP